MATVLITGASRGLGLGLVQRYLERGDRVVAGARDPDAPGLRALPGDRLQRVALDVGDAASIDAAASSLRGVAIDLLVNNAGVSGGAQSFGEVDADDWLGVLRINTLSPLFVTRAFRSNLKRGSSPKVMVISSQLGAMSFPSIQRYAYESSKAAVNKVVRGMAEELRADGIAVFAIHPGWVKTDMGGPGAPISVEASTEGMVKTFDRLALIETGSFYKWDGTEHDW